jgi:hypothetical protein
MDGIRAFGVLVKLAAATAKPCQYQSPESTKAAQ